MVPDCVYFTGSSSIVHEKTHEPLLSILSLIVETAVHLIKDGHRVVIVSSGAIAVGLRRMNVDKRPKYLPRTQVNSEVIYEQDSVDSALGTRSGGTMPTHEPMGKPVRAATAAYSSNTSDEE